MSLSGNLTEGKKVLVCHLPPGNPSNCHTLSIGAPAVRAHLAHGDFLGPCTADCTLPAGETPEIPENETESKDVEKSKSGKNKLRYIIHDSYCSAARN